MLIGPQLQPQVLLNLITVTANFSPKVSSCSLLQNTATTLNPIYTTTTIHPRYTTLNT